MMQQRNWILGAITALSAVWLVVFLIRFFVLDKPGTALVDGAFILLNAILFFIYYRDALRNANVPMRQRHLWTIIVLLGGGIGQLVYFGRFRMRLPQPRSS
jgi:hypothetical protein